jgi:peptidoglycan/xylan/chitin deacetylase (PgdA/CDA1 family)
MSVKMFKAFLKRHAGQRALSMEDLHQQDRTTLTDEYMLTFDDGYKDNLQNLLPIVESYKVPVTIFITTGFIDRNAWPLEYCVSWVLEKNDILTMPGGTIIDIASVDTKKGANEIITKKLWYRSPGYREKWLRQFNEINNTNLKEIEALFLSWDEVRALNKHPLVTIGSHGHLHHPLRGAMPHRVLIEIMHSKKRLQKELSQDITSLAYPYGSSHFFTHFLPLVTGYKKVFTTEGKPPLPWVQSRENLA